MLRWRDGRWVYVDAVHYAPHRLVDVQELGGDFLACSAYKFFGPHIGIMYGRRELLESIEPYKLRPAANDLPGRWMTGTQNHECIAGTLEAIDYIADIGRLQSAKSLARRPALQAAYGSIRTYERCLLERLLDGLERLSDVKIWGITDRDNQNRLPTVSITHPTIKAKQLAEMLAAEAIFVWHGNYYALPLTETIGVEPDGMVRIGLAHEGRGLRVT